MTRYFNNTNQRYVLKMYLKGRPYWTVNLFSNTVFRTCISLNHVRKLSRNVIQLEILSFYVRLLN